MKIDWELPFLEVDYAELEARVQRNLMKTVNFGAAYGMGPQKLADYAADYAAVDLNYFNYPETKPCEKCGELIPIHQKEHGRRPCMYGRAKRDQERNGYVPSHGMFRKLISAAGIPVVRSLLQTRPERLNKHGQYPSTQQGDYAPVWVLLLIQQAKIDVFTSPKRPRVKRLIERLQKTRTDVEEQRVILGEHILQQGPYTAACKALIGKLME